MSGWKAWPLQSWNERLLRHFFRNTDAHPSPVVVLLVTAEELARATGDAEPEASEVRDAFVEAVRAGIRRSKSLLQDASDYEGWPGPPPWESHPRFVAHLLFTCIAASESSDELGDEGSFISRLRDLTGDQLPEHSLQILPRLWEHLAAWLKANEGRFRPLILPNPGSLTRIGYTVRLAFPDRRDQRHLSELLDRAGLSGHEPPIGRVLSLVASERGRFRRSFLVAFDDFRRLFEGSPGRAAPELGEHRFWAAVREAALRGRGRTGSCDATVRFNVLANERGDALALLVVADEVPEGVTVASHELPWKYGDWRFGLLPKGVEAPGQDELAEQLDRVVRDVLGGLLRVPGVSNLVEQGLLPFVVAPHGLLELAVPDQLDEVVIALVRKDLVADLLRLTGNDAGSVQPSPYEGWVELRAPRLRMLAVSEVEGTSLERTWFLQECVTSISLRFVAGIRVDDGWLGVREVLPRVVAPGASRVRLETAEGGFALDETGQHEWSLPSRDLAGEYTLAVATGNGEERRTVRFHAAPASEAFKPASDPDAWIVEEVGGTGTLSAAIPFGDQVPTEDCERLCERVALLGRDVGVFVERPDVAAWKITHFAGSYYGARGSMRDDDAMPTQQVANAHARRRWRKMLFEAVPHWSDAEFAAARRRVKGGASTHVHLPLIQLEQSVPAIASPKLAAPSDAAERLASVVAGRAASRAGIDWSEWSQLATRVLGIDGSLLEPVTRAWMEAGLVDVASYARWWHRAVFARPPQLVAFKIGESCGAVLSGLVLPTSVEEVRRSALRLGLLVEDRLSVSSFVPHTIALRAADRDTLERLASSCHVALRWLDLTAIRTLGASRHDGTSAPPRHYEHSSHRQHWSLQGGEYQNVRVEHRVRPDRPDYWLISGGGRRVWSYELNLARAWAATLLGEPIVKVVGDDVVEAHHAFLPLPLARTVSVLGGGRPGPVNGRYRYPFGNPELLRFVLDVLSRTFDPSCLPLHSSERSDDPCSIPSAAF